MSRLRRSIIKLDASTTHYSRVLVVLNTVLIVLTILMLIPIAKDLSLWPFNHLATTTRNPQPATITPGPPVPAGATPTQKDLKGDFLTWLGGLAISALVGALSSLLVAWYYDNATSPSLELVFDDTPRQTGQQVDAPQHQFLQVKAKQKKGYWPFLSRRVAWNCRAIMEVFDPHGNRAIPERITARWSGSLQPYRTQAVGQQLQQIADTSLFPLGQRFDVHSYSQEQIGIAVKFEGGEDCWIFSNESYLFPRWQNPKWRLPLGRYFIRLELNYESKAPATQWLSLVNDGGRFEDWTVTVVDGVPFR